MLKIGIVIETENKMSGGLGLEGWGKGELADGHGVSLWGHENILLNICEIFYNWLLKNHWFIHFKWVSCMICELSLNKAVKKLLKEDLCSAYKQPNIQKV